MLTHAQNKIALLALDLVFAKALCGNVLLARHTYQGVSFFPVLTYSVQVRWSW